jgi:hypothetical protein
VALPAPFVALDGAALDQSPPAITLAAGLLGRPGLPGLRNYRYFTSGIEHVARQEVAHVIVYASFFSCLS